MDKGNTQSREPIEFGAVASASEHDAIQKWRLNNPDGFILPEPETYVMLLAGLLMVGAVARRKKVAA